VSTRSALLKTAGGLGTAAVAATYALGSRFARDRHAGLVAAGVMAVAFVPVWYSKQALNDMPAVLELRVRDFHGKVVNQTRKTLTVKGNAAVMAWNGGVGDLIAGAAPERVLVQACLVSGSDVVAEDRLYLKPVKDLVLPRPRIGVKAKALGGGEFAVGLTADALAKNLCLGFENVDATFSDNYFDLLPGNPAIVRVKPARAMAAHEIESGLKLMHMAQLSA